MALSQQAQWYLAGPWPVRREPTHGNTRPCRSAMSELVAAGLAVESRDVLGSDLWSLTPVGRDVVARSSGRCPDCGGDGEVGVAPYAWCIRCHGTGLAEPACKGCGEPTALDTVDRAPLECVGVVVHATCDTGHAFFDRRPAPRAWSAA